MKRHALAISLFATVVTALASGSAMLLAAKEPATDVVAVDFRGSGGARRNPVPLIAICPSTARKSCATCHDPDQGFADPRGLATSLGDDGESLGDRNAPTAAYGALVPPLHRSEDGKWVAACFTTGER